MKKYKMMFWISTGLIFLMEGVAVAFTGTSDMAVQGITSLGYPIYFVGWLAAWKILGSLALIIPKVSPRIKEWAYAGFGIDFLSAFYSILMVAGFGVMEILPIVACVLLVVSYISYHKLKA